MWPFRRKASAVGARSIGYSQLDITESFGDDARLGPEDWIETTPLNMVVPDPAGSGLPLPGATDEAIYSVATKLSHIRESASIPNDGVYCPVCHIANVHLNRLRTPCPKCGRALLKFGWD